MLGPTPITNFLLGNNIHTTVAGNITSGSTTLTVSAGTGAQFPSGISAVTPVQVTLRAASWPVSAVLEIVQCTGISTDTLTIVRAQEGTTAVAFNVGDTVEVCLTNQVLSYYNSIPQQLGLAAAAKTNCIQQ